MVNQEAEEKQFFEEEAKDFFKLGTDKCGFCNGEGMHGMGCATYTNVKKYMQHREAYREEWREFARFVHTTVQKAGLDAGVEAGEDIAKVHPAAPRPVQAQVNLVEDNQQNRGNPAP